MKATLTFNLDDESDRESYHDAVNASKVKSALWDFEQALRSMYKYGYHGDKEVSKMTPEEVVEAIRTIYFELINRD